MKQLKFVAKSRQQRVLLGVVLMSFVILASSGGLALAAPAGAALQAAQSQSCSPSAITTAPVNLRTGPGTNYSIILVMPAATKVVVTGRNADSSWYQVVYNGQQGWSSAAYLRTSCVDGVPVVNTSTPPAPQPTPAPAPPAQSGVNFTASSSTINLGQCTVLNWNVQTSGQVFLGYGAMQSPVPLVSSQQVCPGMSSRFYLRVVVNGTSQYYPLDITVVNPYNPANFRSNAYVVNPGQCPTLSWNIDNVNGVFLYLNNTQAQGVAGNATQQVCVSQPSNFGLKVVYNDGREQLTPLTINILNQNPANVVFIANPTTIEPGQCALLQWLVGNASAAFLLDANSGSRSQVGGVGSIEMCPDRTNTYTIQGVFPNGSTQQQSQTVNVAAAQPTPVPLPTPAP